jgi:DNA mismatch repair protein MutH
MEKLPYDKTNAQSIETYAKKLIGLTFLEVIRHSQYISANEDVADKYLEITEEYGNKNRKGGLGNLLEEVYFGYQANSNPKADFEEAGIELKVTPFEYTKKGAIRAGERLVLTMIDYNGPIEPDLYKSHLWEKCRLILLIYYWRNKKLENNLLYLIKYVMLFTPSKTDLAIIENDYKIITQKIINGKAEELSESDTFYLGACTKGSTAKKSIARQYYPPHTPAKKRAFCYKLTYMTYVLNTYIVPNHEDCEPLIKDVKELQNKTFADYVTEKINSFRGKTDKELCLMFNREYNNNKAQWVDLAYRMLGIKSNKAEEFQKANVVVKAIRLEENGKMRESMSFPQFKYKKIINESWEESSLYNYFEETKFLFVVFKKLNDYYILYGCKLWNMPYADLNNDVMQGWKTVVDTIKKGVQISIKQTKRGPIVQTNLLKKAGNRIVHVRPHTAKSYFESIDGTIIGSGSRSNANQLPDGTWLTNYCFWINNDYILTQIESLFKK